jgi:hypothetical protein
MIDELISDIRDLSRPVAEVRTTGLYFLFEAGELVYIGTSNACEARINLHLTERTKRFDRFTIVKQEGKRQRLDWEARLIKTLNPRYNRNPNIDLIRLSEMCQTMGQKEYYLRSLIKKYRVPYDYNDQRDPWVCPLSMQSAVSQEELILQNNRN